MKNPWSDGLVQYCLADDVSLDTLTRWQGKACGDWGFFLLGPALSCRDASIVPGPIFARARIIVTCRARETTSSGWGCDGVSDARGGAVGVGWGLLAGPTSTGVLVRR